MRDMGNDCEMFPILSVDSFNHSMIDFQKLSKYYPHNDKPT